MGKLTEEEIKKRKVLAVLKSREKHKERYKTYMKEYEQKKKGTKERRAHNLVSTYKTEDKKHKRGECTITAQWIIDNIFTKKCVHCGESDWAKLGCNRLDNSKPHTEDNVEPCCHDCNNRLGWNERRKKVWQYTLNGELVAVWESAKDAEKNGFVSECIYRCCLGKYKTHKGFKWSYTPL